MICNITFAQFVAAYVVGGMIVVGIVGAYIGRVYIRAGQRSCMPSASLTSNANATSP